MDEHATRDMRQERPYMALSDNAVIDQAKRIYRKLQESERWEGRDQLLRDWAEVCREMGRRGITDTVTEGHTNTDVLGWHELER